MCFLPSIFILAPFRLSAGLEKVDSAQTTATDDNDRSDSETEIELVETMETISTEHLQEFACSVSVPKRNKKKKKKGGPKAAEGEATPAQSDHVDAPALSEWTLGVLIVVFAQSLRRSVTLSVTVAIGQQLIPLVLLCALCFDL